MAFRSVQNMFFVRFHFNDNETRWQVESAKDRSPSAAEIASELRHTADLIEWFDKPQGQRGPAPERQRK